MPLSDFDTLLDEFHAVERRYWWRPEGRRRIQAMITGAELRNFTALGGRRVETVYSSVYT